MTETHWSKDFVEHMRSVHFTLIAVCAGLLIATSTDNRDAEERTDLTLQKLVEFSQSWESAVRDLYNKTAKTLIETNGEPGGVGIGVIEKQLLMVQVHGLSDSSSVSPEWSGVITMPMVAPLSADQNVPIGQRYGDMQAPPNTLEQFANEWDSHTGSLLFPENYGPWQCQAYVGDLGDLPTEFALHSECKVKSIPSVGSLPRISTKFDWLGGEYAAIVKIKPMSPSAAPYTILVHDVLKTIPNDLRGVWNTAFNEGRKGNFQQEFPELREARARYGNLSFTDAIARVNASRGKSDHTFSAFGLSIPISAIAVWGLMAMVLIQLYFAIHLQTLSDKIPSEAPGWEVAWVGVYQSRLAVLCCAATYFFLPLMTGCSLLISYHRENGWSPLWATSILFIEYLACIVMAFYSLHGMKRIRGLAPWSNKASLSSPE